MFFVENPNLSEVARIVTQLDLLTNVSCQGSIDVTKPLKVNTVRTNYPSFGHRKKQQSELLKRVGHTRQETAFLPSLRRRYIRFAVFVPMINIQREGS